MSIPLPMLYDWQVVNSRGEILVEGAENKARAFTAIPELSLAPHLFMNRRLRRYAPTLNVLATEQFPLRHWIPAFLHLHHGPEEASGVCLLSCQ